MRISLIHGEDSAKAYEKFRTLVDGAKAKGFEIINIDDIHKIVSQSLFEEKLVFTLDKPNKIKQNDWKWLEKEAPKYNSNLLICYEGNAPAILIKNLPKNAKKERFDLPKIIFTFLDSLYPGNSKQSLTLLNDLTQNEPIELVFHLLSRHLRDLYWIKISPKTIPIPIWRANKLKNQATKFSLEKLKNIINNLSEIDIKTKTSNEDLKTSLDFVIIKYLK